MCTKIRHVVQFPSKTAIEANQLCEVQGRGYSGVWGGVTPPQASSLSAKLLRIKVLSAIFRKSILSQEDDS